MEVSFDGTLYPGHCGWDFYFFCLRRHPRILRAVPHQLGGLLIWLFSSTDLTALQAALYSYLAYLPHRDALLRAFWNPDRCTIVQERAQALSSQVTITSLLPNWLLAPVCLPLGLIWQTPTKPVQRTWLTPEFFRFLFIGSLNVVIGWGLEALWSLVIPPNPAFWTGYAMSLGVSYLLNSRITFRAPLAWARFFKFCLSYLPNFVIQSISVVVFYNWLHFPHLLSYLLAAVVGTPVTFLFLKFFTFRRSE